MLVEETLVAVSAARFEAPTTCRVPPIVVLPVEETLPDPETRNWVEEFTCRFRKSPLKPEAMFAPMYVPVVCESWMVLGPSWKREELVEEGGTPVRRRAVPEREDCRYPVAKRLVLDTEARLDWPETFKAPPTVA